MKLINKILGSLLFIYLLTACDKNSDLINYGQDMHPKGLKVEIMQNSYPPFIVGERLNLSIAAGSPTEGKLSKLEITASLPGSTGTILNTRGLFYNWTTGMDDIYTAFKDASTTGNVSIGNYVDTIAATGSYSYVIPPEARGQKITFSCKVSTATTSQTQIAEFTVSNIIMQKGISMGVATVDGSGKAFFSIADSKAYSRTEVETGNLYSNIDFVYVNDPVGPATSWKLNKAALAPANQYMPAGMLGSNWTNPNASQIEIKNWEDYQLAGNTGKLNMVDDVDFQQSQIVTTTMMAINLTASSRFLVKSVDGKWIALVWITSATNTSLTFSMKKYQLK